MESVVLAWSIIDQYSCGVKIGTTEVYVGRGGKVDKGLLESREKERLGNRWGHRGPIYGGGEGGSSHMTAALGGDLWFALVCTVCTVWKSWKTR